MCAIDSLHPFPVVVLLPALLLHRGLRQHGREHRPEVLLDVAIQFLVPVRDEFLRTVLRGHSAHGSHRTM